MRKYCFISLAAMASCFAYGQSFNGGPGVIPDNNPAGVSVLVNVSGLGAGAQLTKLSFTGLSHTWVGDLRFRLTDPSANTIDIFYRPGWVGSGFGLSSDLSPNNSYAWVRTGGADFWAAAAGTPIPSGNYAPGSQNGTGTQTPTSFSSFVSGAAANGNWTMFAVDGAGGDTGGWQTVTLTFAPVPEPASIAVLGLGAAALIRRRRRK